MSMNTIAFDLGGSSGKVFLGSYSGSRLSVQKVHSFKNSSTAINDSLFWNIISIYSNLLEGIQKASAQSCGRISSAGLDSFSNDFGLIDPCGDLLSPVHCYRDGRTTRYRQQIDRVMPPQQRHRLSGNQVAPSNTLMHLASMVQAGQTFMLQNAYKILLVPDLLIQFLTGQAVSEYTISSVSEMYDFEKKSWNRKILSAYQIPESLMAPIVFPGTFVGGVKKQLCDSLHISSFPVVSVCEHDTASAYLSAPCAGDCAIISSGTWSLVGTEVSAPIISEYTYRYNIANEGGYQGSHHRMVKSIMGLWILQEVQSCLASQNHNLTFDELGELARGAKPFVFLIDPDDIAFFRPGNMPQKIQEKCREKYGAMPESIGEIVRCVLESLALKYRWAIECLERVTDKQLPVIHIVGGGSQDAFLCQLAADASNKPVIAGPADATAFGNLMVQLIAHGELSGIEEGRKLICLSSDIRQYTPRQPEIWDEVYEDFKTRYQLP